MFADEKLAKLSNPAAPDPPSTRRRPPGATGRGPTLSHAASATQAPPAAHAAVVGALPQPRLCARHLGAALGVAALDHGAVVEKVARDEGGLHKEQRHREAARERPAWDALAWSAQRRRGGAWPASRPPRGRRPGAAGSRRGALAALYSIAAGLKRPSRAQASVYSHPRCEHDRPEELVALTAALR